MPPQNPCLRCSVISWVSAGAGILGTERCEYWYCGNCGLVLIERVAAAPDAQSQNALAGEIDEQVEARGNG